MADRSVHYEAAFEDYIRSRGLPYVAVDEAKKAIFGTAAIKSFDFLVYGAEGPNLLIDVKGRKFPGDIAGRKRGACKTWENWITLEDAEGLTEWEKIFGRDFRAVLIFAYWLQGRPGRSPFGDIHIFRRKHYAFAAISLADYLKKARPRSDRWGTLAMAGAEFARAARDIAELL